MRSENQGVHGNNGKKRGSRSGALDGDETQHLNLASDDDDGIPLSYVAAAAAAANRKKARKTKKKKKKGRRTRDRAAHRVCSPPPGKASVESAAM